MIKTIFTFFQVQIKCVFRYAIEFLQASFGIRPKTFDAVNMRIIIHEFIGTVINPKMFRVANINQSVLAAPLVRVNYGIQRNAPANHPLQRFLRAVGDNFSINRNVSFEDAKDFGFADAPRPRFPLTRRAPK